MIATGIRVKGIAPYLFILPILVGVGLFGYGALGYITYLSFHQTSLIGSSKFVGIENFISVFQNEWFFVSLFHTMMYAAVFIPLSMTFGLFLGSLMSRKIHGGIFFRFVYLLPWVSSAVIIALLFRYILNPEWGLANYILKVAGLKAIAFTQTPGAIVAVVAFISAWQSMGFGMIIFMSAIRSIPEEIYDAACMDGAGSIRTFVSVTLPLIKPVLLFFLVYAVVGAFQVFDAIYVFCEGVPSMSSALDFHSLGLVCNYFIYLIAFRRFAFGQASAMALVMFLFVIVIIILGKKATGSEETVF